MKTLTLAILLCSSAFAQDFATQLVTRLGKNAPSGGNTYSNQITINYNRTTGGTSQANKYGLLANGQIIGTGSDDLGVGLQGSPINYSQTGPCVSSASCGVGYLMGVVGQPINRGTVHELDGVVGYAAQIDGAIKANWVKGVRSDLVLTAGTVGNASLYGTAHFVINPGVVTNLYGVFLPSITQGANNWAIKTGLGKVEFGDTVQAQGYKSADGSQGFTGSNCTLYKEGLCVAGF